MLDDPMIDLPDYLDQVGSGVIGRAETVTEIDDSAQERGTEDRADQNPAQHAHYVTEQRDWPVAHSRSRAVPTGAGTLAI